eukprot:4282076-Pyramimonas_sp.AAC.1
MEPSACACPSRPGGVSKMAVAPLALARTTCFFATRPPSQGTEHGGPELEPCAFTCRGRPVVHPAWWHRAEAACFHVSTSPRGAYSMVVPGPPGMGRRMLNAETLKGRWLNLVTPAAQGPGARTT